MTTTYNQAKRLKELGYKELVHGYYLADGKLSFHTGIFNWNKYATIGTFSASSVSEALQWIREKKGIPCSVHLEFEVNNKEWFYYGEWGLIGDNKVYTTATFDTYPLAESTLLDELLTYLEQKR